MASHHVKLDRQVQRFFARAAIEHWQETGEVSSSHRQGTIAASVQLDSNVVLLSAGIYAYHVPIKPSWLHGRTRGEVRSALPIVRELFRYLDANRVSYADIAALAGVTPVTLGRWKSGAASPRWAELENVVMALHGKISITWPEKGPAA